MGTVDTKESASQKPTSAEENIMKEADKLEKKEYSSVISQVESEYKLAKAFMQPKWDEWIVRLKLYNNQKRDKSKIGDPLLFTIHQTVLASLYDDKLSVDWQPREEGDEEVAENLNALFEFDYDEMEKSQLDYDWDWDALFFGYGLMMLTDWDKKSKTPIPEIIDPMTWLRDPRATSVNGGKRGHGGLRFHGRMIRLTKRELMMNPSYVNVNDVIDQSSGDDETIFKENRKARADAQGYQDTKYQETLKGENKDYPVLEWMTYANGQPTIITLANNMKTVVRFQPLKSRWPITSRDIYPMSHIFSGLSIPDLIEDKQRARAVSQNLALESIQAGQYPMYFYNSKKITNPQDVAEYQFNKFVPVAGDPGGAVAPLERQQVKQEVQWIMEMLDTGAQRSTATPEIQQGVTQEKVRSATEMAMVQNKVDTRYSLSAKIFGWSEKEFAKQWHDMYKRHFKEGIDEKKIRIMGAMGRSIRPLQRDNIIGQADLDVDIESKIVSEAKRLNDFQIFSGLMGTVANDPTANLRYGEKHLAKLAGLTSGEVDRLLPPTVDELEAEEENDNLNANRPAKITMAQDHQTHLMTHSKAAETVAKNAHMKGHRIAMMIARERPEIMEEGVGERNAGMVEGEPEGAPPPRQGTPKVLQTA